MMPLSVGQVIHERYRIAGLLGQGGMGAVYRGWHLALKVPVAIKENLDASPEAQRQFEKEAQILARLSHPNLPRVTDYFFIPGQGQYLVMDYVEGDNLESIVQKQGLQPEAQALAWMEQICDALAYLHSQPQPIIHRDIKPANVRITPAGKAMLVDFGIAKVFDPHLATTVGAKAVTAGYSPPEQYGGGKTDQRSDIYSLGATLYTLLTGWIPPESTELVVGAASLQTPRKIVPGLSPRVEQVVLKCMEISQSQRYQQAEQVRADLAKPTAARPSMLPSFKTHKVASESAVSAAQATPAAPTPASSGAPAQAAGMKPARIGWASILGYGIAGALWPLLQIPMFEWGGFGDDLVLIISWLIAEIAFILLIAVNLRKVRFGRPTNLQTALAAWWLAATLTVIFALYYVYLFVPGEYIYYKIGAYALFDFFTAYLDIRGTILVTFLLLWALHAIIGRFALNTGKRMLKKQTP
ncbi:MAG: serine/threonine protein kinase [Anaerolineales bacterium]|nr:serine/threonine protein kinase [Anaerolineales bacterium]